MDGLLKFIPAATAVAFVCASAFLLGQAAGFGDVTLFSNVTFGDIVNAAPSVVASYGLVVFWSVFSGEKRRIAFELAPESYTPLSWSRWKDGGRALLACAALIFAAYYYKPELGVLVGLLCVLVCLLYGYLFPVLAKQIGISTVHWFERLSWAALLMVVWGYTLGSETTGSYQILLEGRAVDATKLLRLERGVIIARSDGYELIPWDRVISLRYIRPASP